MADSFRVFLSSTSTDLAPWRDAISTALALKPDVKVIQMEDFVSGPPPWDLCMEKVALCQIFVGLVGFRYGSAPKGRRISYTQGEYEEAVRREIPCLMHVAPGGHALEVDYGENAEVTARLGRFRAKVMRGGTAARDAAWDNPDRLALHVAQAVQEQIDRARKAEQPGFTAEKYAARLRARVQVLTEQLADDDTERAQLQTEKDELTRRLSDVDAAFAEAEKRIAELEALLEREGNHLGSERLDRAEKALEEGDFDEADTLLAEIEDDEELAVKRAARAAFGRGKIAEERVRWHEAADHYAKAARLDPTYDHLKSARLLGWRAGDYPRAEALGTELLRVARAEHGETAPEFALALNDHALTLKAMGRLDEAEPLYRQAMEITKTALGEGHPDYAIRLNNLANLLQDMGRLEEAEPLYRQAIEIDKATIGEGHPNYAIDLNNLAGLLQDMGRLDEAEPHYRQAIKIIKEQLGESHPNYATSLNNLADLLFNLGRHDDAEPLARQAVAIMLAALGEQHPHHAFFQTTLARICHALGKVEEARALYAQAMPVLRNTLGDEHVLTRKAAGRRSTDLRAANPEDPELAELEQIFGEGIGRE